MPCPLFRNKLGIIHLNQLYSFSVSGIMALPENLGRRKRVIQAKGSWDTCPMWQKTMAQVPKMEIKRAPKFSIWIIFVALWILNIYYSGITTHLQTPLNSFYLLLHFNTSCNSQIITGLQELEFHKPTSIPRWGKLCSDLPELTSHNEISWYSFYLFGVIFFKPCLFSKDASIPAHFGTSCDP